MTMYTAIRHQVEAQMGMPVPAEIWRRIEDDGLPELVATGRRDLNWLTDRIWARLPQARPPRQPLVSPATPLAVAARSVAFAAEAARDPEVERFRREVLRGRLLAPDAVEPWIQRQARRDGRGGWLRIALPPGIRVTPTRAGLRLDPPVREIRAPYERSVDALEYARPDSAWVQVIPVAPGGQLDALRRLSTRLADRFGWQPALATLFVLTGRIPAVEPIQITISSRAGGRVRLDVDPAVSPERLAAAYRRVRRDLFRGRRFKSQSEKHLRLALLRLHHPDAPWPDLVARWNAEQPRARYPRAKLAQFIRDVRAAVARVAAPRLTDEQVWRWAAQLDEKRTP